MTLCLHLAWLPPLDVFFASRCGFPCLLPALCVCFFDCLYWQPLSISVLILLRPAAVCTYWDNTLFLPVHFSLLSCSSEDSRMPRKTCRAVHTYTSQSPETEREWQVQPRPASPTKRLWAHLAKSWLCQCVDMPTEISLARVVRLR